MARPRRPSITKARSSLVGLAVAILFVGCRPHPPEISPGNVERIWVPLAKTPLRGPATAKITAVIFGDFESPYCARVVERMSDLQRQYKDALRMQFRHRPLPNYEHSQLAAEAAMAAAEQGQFWRYHDLLYARKGLFDRPTLERYATDLKLDLSQFRDAIDSERARKLVDADSILAADLGFRGAPVVVVNGRPLRGVPDVATLKQIFDEEIVAAERLLKSGVAPQDLYKRLAQPNTVERAPLPATPSPSSAPRLDSQTVYKVEVEKSPARGPADAKVTLVLWSDFECAQCVAIEPILNAVAAAHPADVRIVWKNRPVPDHFGALLAAEAALAAAQQGRFWPMHDRLFAQPVFERPRLEEMARDLGLDLIRFRAALDDRTYAPAVAADLAQSERLGISNLPTVFMNGKPIARTALSKESLDARVAAELESADDLLKKGVPRERLYDTLISQGLDGVPGPGLDDLPPLPRGTYLVEVGDSPTLGPATAPVTLITFSDFQCPYSARWANTLTRLRKHFGDRLRIVWKDAPDPDHKDALGAHEAARAAAAQGRFWEMHDKIFANPYLLRPSVFERYAVEIGLDLARFKSDLAQHQAAFREAIRQETAYGISLAGPAGTPTAFVNGRLIPGAYPFDVMRRIIDEEILRHPAQSALAAR